MSSDCFWFFRGCPSGATPSISNGATVYADMSAYDDASPQRWDVVVFNPPPVSDQDMSWAMRLVGLPGETLSISNRTVIIDGRVVSPPPGVSYLARMPDMPAHTPLVLEHPYHIPADSYVVLGDNTTNAFDSRYFGPIRSADLRGKVTITP